MREQFYSFYLDKEGQRQHFCLKASKEQANPSFLCRGITSETTVVVCNYAVNMPIMFEKKSVLFYFLLKKEEIYKLESNYRSEIHLKI